MPLNLNSNDLETWDISFVISLSLNTLHQDVWIWFQKSSLYLTQYENVAPFSYLHFYCIILIKLLPMHSRWHCGEIVKLNSVFCAPPSPLEIPTHICSSVFKSLFLICPGSLGSGHLPLSPHSSSQKKRKEKNKQTNNSQPWQYVYSAFNHHRPRFGEIK